MITNLRMELFQALIDRGNYSQASDCEHTEPGLELTRCCIRSSAKEREFTSLVSRERQRYFWTGGRMSGGRVTWPSGRQYTQVNWSHTGG